MVVINWNMDLGDAWEHADMEEYDALYTATAYRLGVNYVMYGMSHSVSKKRLCLAKVSKATSITSLTI